MEIIELTKADMRETFRIAFNGNTNFMTPNIIDYEQHGRYICEISSGEFMGKTYYGVTALTQEGDKTDYSKSFASLPDAVEYMDGLETLDFINRR